QPLDIPAAHVVVHARPRLVSETYPGESLVLVTDAEQHLVAMISRTGEVRQALWTASLFLSVLHHDRLVCCILTQVLDHALAGKMTFAQLKAARERLR